MTIAEKLAIKLVPVHQLLEALRHDPMFHGISVREALIRELETLLGEYEVLARRIIERAKKAEASS